MKQDIRQRLKFPIALQRFYQVEILLFLVWLGSVLYRRHVLHIHDYYLGPFRGTSRFYDLECFRSRFVYYHTPGFFETAGGEPFMYPPLIAVLYRFFYLATPATSLFLGVTLTFLGFLVVLLVRALSSYNLSPLNLSVLLVPTLLLSFPLWLEYHLGNMEICVFFVIAGGVLLFLKDKGYGAAMCFGIAGALKIFPVIYLGLLLARKQYRQCIFGLSVVALSTVIAFWLLCSSYPYAVPQVADNLAKFKMTYVLHYRFENTFDHSFFGLLKFLFPPIRSFESLTLALRIYLPITAFLGIAAFALRIRHLPVANQVLCLTIASVFLPPTSHDYTLIQLYVPWALLALVALNAESSGMKVAGLLGTMVCLAVLFAPETEFLQDGRPLGGQIKSTALLVLCWFALKYPFVGFPPSRNGELHAGIS